MSQLETTTTPLAPPSIHTALYVSLAHVPYRPWYLPATSLDDNTQTHVENMVIVPVQSP